MKKVTCFLITILLLLSAISSLHAQTTQGKEFWITFGKFTNYVIHPEEAIKTMHIRVVAGSQPTKATIYFTNLDTSISFNLDAYEIYTYSLDITQKLAMYNMYMAITNYSARITTTEPVSVYALLYLTTSAMDATNILPVTSLGTEYFHCSYTDESTIHTDAYAVVATQNNTNLYHNGMLVTPMPLNAGQVYYRTSFDMTGAYITSNNPVAFFALHQGTRIPAGSYLPTGLIQQLSPVHTWDRTYFVPVTVKEQEIVRIVVSQNNTNITQIGGTIQTGVPGAQTTLTGLKKGEFVELDIGSNGCYIYANNPVGVCSYMKCIGTMPYPTVPSQVWIPGIKQTASYVLMSHMGNVNAFAQKYLAHLALIVTPTAMRESTKVSIGGMPPTELSGGNWIENATAEMSFYSMLLTNDTASYIFSNSAGILVFGYGTGANMYGGYYYLAGSAMRELDAMFYANDVYFGDLEEHPFCENEEVAFQAEINGLHSAQESIKWYIDDLLQPALTDHLTWSQTFPIGEYEITMWVRLENNSTVSKTGNLKIVNCNMSAEFYVNNVHYESLEDTLFCNKNVYFKADIEGLSQEMGSLKWYIGGIEYEEARDRLEWN